MANKYLIKFIDGSIDVVEAESVKQLVIVERWVESIIFLHDNNDDACENAEAL